MGILRTLASPKRISAKIQRASRNIGDKVLEFTSPEFAKEMKELDEVTAGLRREHNLRINAKRAKARAEKESASEPVRVTSEPVEVPQSSEPSSPSGTTTNAGPTTSPAGESKFNHLNVQSSPEIAKERAKRIALQNKSFKKFNRGNQQIKEADKNNPTVENAMFRRQLEKTVGIGKVEDYTVNRLMRERKELRQQFKDGKLEKDERFESLDDINKYVMGEGKKGPEFMDHLNAYGIPKKAAITTVGLAGLATINNMFDGGEKSNAELYSNPF